MNLRIILVAFFIFYNTSAFSSLRTVSGKVIDANTKEALAGATISIPDLRISSIADMNGEFTFRNVPAKGKFLIEVTYLGYKTLTRNIDLSIGNVLEIGLYPSVIEAREVVITGTAFSTDNRKNSTAVTAVSRDQLINNPSGSLIDAIAKVPGVSQITTGGGISKPVIRGLSYNRVLTLIDGAKQEGQQWGDEHGLEADQFNAGRVEVLRGAASLLYGSDALGGVINILEPLPAPEGKIRAELLSNYSGNNGLTGNSVMLQGNSNGFIWQGRGSYKNAYSYNAPGGRIANTGYNETSLSSQLGLNKRWGFAHLNLSSFKNNIGLPNFSRNVYGQFEDAQGGIISNEALKDRNLFLPFQNIRHYKIALNSNLLFGDNHLHTTLAFQNNQRREIAVAGNDPSLFFDLKTFSYDLKYFLKEAKGWEPVIGLAGSFQENKNRAAELLIPDYKANDIGIFTYLKRTWLKSTFNFGARYDYRNITGIEMLQDGQPKFNNFNNRFSNLSGAAGFTYEFNEFLNFKSNLGSAFRSPNIAELSADGIHEGTFRYEIGNNNLKPENSFYGDAALELSSGKIQASLGVFNNYIANYIFSSQRNSEIIDVDGKNYPVFRFVQANANLYGAEAALTIHPVESFHFENSFSFTHAQNKETNTALPFIPAAALRNEIKLEPKIGGFSRKSYLAVRLDNVFRQNRVDRFETPTPGYTLVNASMGTTLMLNKQPLRLNISANNLFNKAYYDHLSRFKPGRLDEGNPNEGYYNQGRNVSVGLFMPLNLK
ncbi:MAG: TonB-dependent receptor [Flavobacterium sp.]|nr:TonB-dependent receptor [Pedobacter sp.]